MRSENLNELAAALAKAQGAMEAAAFNRVNPHFKNRYADLAAIWDAIRIPLSSNGLAVTQVTEIRERGFVLVTTLHHASGQWLAGEYALPVGGRPQEVGSALTYARRYSLCGIVGIVADDDDDAEAGNKVKASEPEPKRPNPHRTPPEDISDGEPNGEIPHVDGVVALPKAKSRETFAELEAEMVRLETLPGLMAWGKTAAATVATMHEEFQATFRRRFAEYRDELKSLAEAAE